MLLYCNNMFSSNDKLSNLKNNLERNSVKTTNILTSIASISKKKKKYILRLVSIQFYSHFKN